MPASPPARYYPFAWDTAGYRRGRYVVVAGLTPLSEPLVDHAGRARADDRVLQCDRELPAYRTGKRAEPQRDACDPALRDAVHAVLLPEARREYGIAGAPTLDALVGGLQEDVVVAAVAGAASTIVYAHVSHPSGWDPETLCGMPVTSFARMHAALARHMGADAVKGLAGERWIAALAAGGASRRFTWGLQLDPGLAQHPGRRPRIEVVSDVWLRVERQVAIGLPAHRALLFLIRPYVVPLADVRAAGVMPDLVAAVRGMDAGQAAYKLGARRDDVLRVLARSET